MIDILIPLKDVNAIDGADIRLRNCVSSLRRNDSRLWRLCISDASTVNSELPIDGEYEKVWCPQQGVFSKSACINTGFKKLIRADAFIILDLDAMVPPDFMERISEIWKRWQTFLILAVKYMSNGTNQLTTWEQLSKEPVQMVGYSTCDMIASWLFTKINGYDERYIGWGHEDNDYRFRATQGCDNKYFVTQPENMHVMHQHHDIYPWRRDEKLHEKNGELYNGFRAKVLSGERKVWQIKGLTDCAEV